MDFPESVPIGIAVSSFSWVALLVSIGIGNLSEFG